VVKTEGVEIYDSVVHILSGEQIRKLVKILINKPKTLPEIRSEVPEEVDNPILANLLSTLEKYDLIKQGGREGEILTSPTYIINKERLAKYVGRHRELKSFYEKLL